MRADHRSRIQGGFLQMQAKLPLCTGGRISAQIGAAHQAAHSADVFEAAARLVAATWNRKSICRRGFARSVCWKLRSEDPSAERDLVSAMLAGEQRAFTAFFDSNFPRIYRFALPRLARNEEACKEVAQATLVKAMRKLSTWRGEASLFTWICQICRNEIADHIRSIERPLSHARMPALCAISVRDGLGMKSRRPHSTSRMPRPSRF